MKSLLFVYFISFFHFEISGEHFKLDLKLNSHKNEKN